MLEAYVLVMASSGTARSLLSEIRDLDGVERANVVAGEFDIVALIEAESRQQLLSLVTDDIQTIDGAGRTRTMIVLE